MCVLFCACVHAWMVVGPRGGLQGTFRTTQRWAPSKPSGTAYPDSATVHWTREPMRPSRAFTTLAREAVPHQSSTTPGPCSYTPHPQMAASPRFYSPKAARFRKPGVFPQPGASKVAVAPPRYPDADRRDAVKPVTTGGMASPRAKNRYASLFASKTGRFQATGARPSTTGPNIGPGTYERGGVFASKLAAQTQREKDRRGLDGHRVRGCMEKSVVPLGVAGWGRRVRAHRGWNACRRGCHDTSSVCAICVCACACAWRRLPVLMFLSSVGDERACAVAANPTSIGVFRTAHCVRTRTAATRTGALQLNATSPLTLIGAHSV